MDKEWSAFRARRAKVTKDHDINACSRALRNAEIAEGCEEDLDARIRGTDRQSAAFVRVQPH